MDMKPKDVPIPLKGKETQSDKDGSLNLLISFEDLFWVKPYIKGWKILFRCFGEMNVNVWVDSYVSFFFDSNIETSESLIHNLIKFLISYCDCLKMENLFLLTGRVRKGISYDIVAFHWNKSRLSQFQRILVFSFLSYDIIKHRLY
jgi:hypothetical protein